MSFAGAALAAGGGVGGSSFAPDDSMTRGMLVTVLHRLEGTPAAGENTFSDVAEGQWYTDSIAWGASIGLIEGVGGNLFRPDDELNREQIATMLQRLVTLMVG